MLSDGGRIKALRAPGGGQLSRKELDALVQDTKGRGAAGLVWMVVEANELRSPVTKFLSKEEASGIVDRMGAQVGDLILMVADKADRVAVALDGLRRSLAVRLDLIPADTWTFCWQTDPPLFEWSEEESRWTSVHHLFTAPKDPENPDYLWQLASIQIRLRTWQDADRTVKTLSRLKPDDPDVQHYLEVLRKQTSSGTNPPEGRHDRKR